MDAFHLILILFHGFKIVDATGDGVVTEVKAKFVGVAPKAIHYELLNEAFVFGVHNDYWLMRWCSAHHKTGLAKNPTINGFQGRPDIEVMK